MVPGRMAKSLVERYSQLLAQDPASSVFVELAKALIAKGEHAPAIAVCEQGIAHHPNSVTGRVLWGKALILMGRPAEAMAQFDSGRGHRQGQPSRLQPHRRGAAAARPLPLGAARPAQGAGLQPNDARVRGWMEQAQAALSGGPAPGFGDLNTLETPTSAEAPARRRAGGRRDAAPARGCPRPRRPPTPALPRCRGRGEDPGRAAPW